MTGILSESSCELESFLCAIMESLASLEDLVVVDAGLCAADWVAICRALATKLTLRRLSLAGMHMTEECLQTCTDLLHERMMRGLKVTFASSESESESDSEDLQRPEE